MVNIRFEGQEYNYNPEKILEEIRASEPMREILEIDQEKDVEFFRQGVRCTTKDELIPFMENYEFKNFCNLEVKKAEKQIAVLDSFEKKILIESKESIPTIILNLINEKLATDFLL